MLLTNYSPNLNRRTTRRGFAVRRQAKCSRLKAGLQTWTRNRRRVAGVSALDYALLLGIILPLATFLFWIAPRIMNLVYEMVCALIAWPFS